jgi:aminodeoxychorismate synthase component I
MPVIVARNRRSREDPPLAPSGRAWGRPILVTDSLLEFPLEGLPACLRFCGPRKVLQARSQDEVTGVLGEAEALSRQGAWVLGFVSYEAAPAFDRALRVRPAGPLPLAWFAVYGPPSPDPPFRGDPASAGMRPTTDAWAPGIDRARYESDFARIHRALEDGVAYQVNYTFPLLGRVDGDPRALFDALRPAQPGGYRAFLDLGGHQVLSLSPELFFACEGRNITARPMKGTAPRGRDAREDEEIARWLSGSPKNQAENRMIVDLLRNDLSRVAVTGSVRVPKLFEVLRLPTLHQMTSTVTARLRDDATLVDIFRAMFPCGSVTGAPKPKAMELIATLEGEPRGVYCGAVGVLRPGGDATFNVAIRTMTIDAGTRAARFPVGGGIVWDSRAGEEYDEALLKARVLGG